MDASKYTVLLLALVAAHVCVTSGFLDCPDHKGCKCSDEKIECDCQADDVPLEDRDADVIIPSNLNPDLSMLKIRRCASVMIPNYGITNVALKTVRFADIDNMTISTLGINILSNIDVISFENIARFLPGRFALAYFNNITRFELINVTSPGFPQSSFFELNNVQTFLIKDSNIGELRSNSIITSNGTLMTIENSTITKITNSSVITRNQAQFHFRNNKVQSWHENGMGLQNVGQLKLTGNSISSIGRGFLFIEFGAEVSINQNNIGTLQSGAMENHFSVSRTSIFQNFISDAKVDSLTKLFEDNNSDASALFVSENTFTCGCQVEWITKKLKDQLKFLENNFCLSPRSGDKIPFKELSFVYDNQTKCLNFVELEKIAEPAAEDDVPAGRGANNSGVSLNANSSKVVRSETGANSGGHQETGSLKFSPVLLTVFLITEMFLS